MLSDLHSAIRALLSARAFTAIALVTLSVGLALCITVLTIVNAYVIRALPYPAADRLYRVDYAAPGQSPPRRLESLDWSALDDVIEHPIAWDLDVFYLGRARPTLLVDQSSNPSIPLCSAAWH